MKEIREKWEVPEKAMYYSVNNEQKKGKFERYYTFFDQDFEVIESAKVRYTNAIAHLRQIIETRDPFVEAMYTLTPTGNGYFFVDENSRTSEAGLAIMEGLKRQKGWR